MPPPSLRLTYLAHTQRSDWNNGNAHFLRGLLRSLAKVGHTLNLLEPEHEWSITNLRAEPLGEQSLAQFATTYPDLPIRTYPAASLTNEPDRNLWRSLLADQDIVILHEWNPPALAHLLLSLRNELGYKLLFHDTHHRASSSPESFASLRLHEFDGVLAFGEVLREIYQSRFGMTRVWTLHEAADTSVFHPLPLAKSGPEAVWIGNWGDNERSAEIREFFLAPAAALRPQHTFGIFGVRYPEDGLAALAEAGVAYGGYLPNLDAPATYARARLTVHIPRQQYSTVMRGIPTIRVFEALACGIPLLSAPWDDCEHLFRPGDLRFVHSAVEMTSAMRDLLSDSAAAQAYANRGHETVLARHTCDHRAQELTAICNQILHKTQEAQPA